MKMSILAVILIIVPALLVSSCVRNDIDRGEVFSAVEMTVGLPDEANPVKDDLIKRGLFTIPTGNGTSGEIKIGEIEQLVKVKTYIIDEDGYLQFGPSYTPGE